MITKETIQECPTRIALDRLVQGVRPEEVEPELRLAIAERYFVFAEDRHETADLIFSIALVWLGDQPFPYDDVDLGHAYCGEATRQMVANRTDIESLRLPSGSRLADWIPAILNNVQLRTLRATFVDLQGADLQVLETLPHLEYLNLDYSNLTDTGLESISRLRSLERLFVTQTKVTSKGLAQWLPTTLCSLSLSHTTLDADLGAKLAGCPNLENLHVKRSVVRIEGLRSLKNLPNLSRLWLDNCQLEYAHIEILSEIYSLEDLSLDANAFTDVGLAFLARLPKLKELRVDEANLTSDGFNALKENSTLEVLSLDRAGSLAGLARPKWMGSIRDLRVHDCELDEDFLTMLGEAVNLEELSIGIEELDPAPLLELLQGLPVKELTLFLSDNSNHPVRCPSPLPLLEEVWLGISKAKRESIESWLKNPNLKFFDAAVCEFEPGPPIDFSGCPLLEDLNLYQTSITDEDLTSLRNHPSLQILKVGETEITDEGLKLLGCLKSLHTLDIGNTKICGESIDWASQFPSLVNLRAEEAPITDLGLRQILLLPNLESLWLQGTAISESGYSALENNESIRDLWGIRVGENFLESPVLPLLASMKSLTRLDFENRLSVEDRAAVLTRLRELGAPTLAEVTGDW